MDKLEWQILGKRLTSNGATQIYAWQEGAGNATTIATAKKFINGLLFAESKSIRTSTVILAAFNILAALATALSILYDCYCAAKRNVPSYKPKKGFVNTIHPAETFPLILATGIVVQGLVFAASQGTGLQSLLANGCATTAQFMLPAIFLVPFIQVVFGAECAIRSLKASPFPPRGKWVVPVCLVIIALMEIGVWVPTHLDPEKDRCFASLAWFVEHFGKLALIILSATGGLTIIIASVIFYRLTTVSSIGQCQRIAASRMVYYLVLAIVSLAFVLPWFVTLTMKRPNIVTSMMATVVLNLTGLMTGLLQLFLRSNSATTSFRPRGLPGWNPMKREIRLWGPNDLSFGGHMLQPVSGPRSPASISSRTSLVAIEKTQAGNMESPESPKYGSPKKHLAPNSTSQQSEVKPTIHNPPVSTSTLPSSRFHSRNTSYSMFPPPDIITSPIRVAQPQQQLQIQQPELLLPSSTFSTNNTAAPATTSKVKNAMSGLFYPRGDLDSVYSTTDLTPPRPIFSGLSPYGHRRDSSMVSSATVQIGLRLSHAMNSVESLQSTLPSTSNYPNGPLRRPNSPNLQVQTHNIDASNSSEIEATTKSPPLSKADRDARMKTLPPVPRVSSDVRDSVKSTTQLSPTVYTPLSKKAKSPLANASSSSPVASSPKHDSQVDKADWI